MQKPARRPEQPPQYALQSVDRALRLIEMLRDVGSLKLTEAAQELGVSPSTAHRLLAMLAYRGFAVQDDNRVYVPGPSLGQRPVGASGTRDLLNVVQPHLVSLAAETKETANLMVRAGLTVRVLSTVESSQVLRVGDRRGAVLPADRAATGKAILAELDPRTLNTLLQHVPAGSRGALIRELDAVARDGYAINVEGTETGVCAIGVTVHQGRAAVGAISVSLPATRFSDAARENIVQSLLATRRAIDGELTQQPLEG